MLASIRKCFAILSARMRLRWVGLIPLAVTVAALESMGAAGVFAFITIINEPTQVATVPVVSALYRVLPWQEGKALILSLAIALAAFYILKNILVGLIIYLQSRVVSNSAAELSAQLFKGYLTVPFAFHLQRNSAEVIRTTTDSVQQTVQGVMEPALGIVTETFVLMGILTVLMITAPLATVIAALFLGCLIGLLLRVTKHPFSSWGVREQELRREILQTLQQSLGALKEVKVMGREHFFFGIFASLQAGLARIQYLRSTLSLIPNLLIETVFVCGMLLVVGLVTVRASAPQDVLPLLGLYAYAGFRIIPSMNRVLMKRNFIRHGSGAVDIVYSDFMLLRDSMANGFESRPMVGPSLGHHMVLTGVSYAYEGASAPALRDINLTITCGESLGIVGATGAGKSTLINIILGLLQPSSGEITVDGRSILGSKSSWLSRISYVPQEVYLTDDSLRRNIALGCEDQEIVEARVRASVRMAQLESFIDGLPQGLDTTVGERGIRLSGGQRQRIAIARALYSEPELIVFDEATSALDNRTEAEVTRAMQALHGVTTLIIIAHRLSTVRVCDRLVFLHNGQLTGTGTFDELLQENREFREMVSRPGSDEAPL